MKKSKLGYDPNDIALAYNIKVNNKSCEFLNDWISATYTFNDFEQTFFERIYKDAHVDAAYWNEEELKIKMVGLLFSLADIEVFGKAKVKRGDHRADGEDQQPQHDRHNKKVALNGVATTFGANKARQKRFFCFQATR